MAKKRAHSLFQKLAADLATTCPDYPDIMLCPLCLTEFKEKAIDLPEPELTEEHVIPGELGGRLRTLTCKRCNNLHGAELDSHLIQRLRVQDSLDGVLDLPFKGQIEIAGMPMPTDVEWRAHRHEVTTFRLRRFKPAVHDAMIESFRNQSVETIRLHFSFDYIPYRTQIAVLRIAYLAAFRKWGYRYILAPVVQSVRALINNFGNVNEQVVELVGQIRNISPVPQEPVVFQMCEGLPAIMVIIRLKAVIERYYVTFLPMPTLPPEAMFEVLLRAVRGVQQSPRS